ncbi:MAG: hypothetical protein D6B28_09715 [Gammaproteobacteria bacterium]|nr:MAG: hypothetical protein D6B28_09715 [Gammaproteobacteria bacterium]
MSNLIISDALSDNTERRRFKRRQVSDRRSFQRFEPGKLTADRRRSLSDRRESETIGRLSLV